MVALIFGDVGFYCADKWYPKGSTDPGNCGYPSKTQNVGILVPYRRASLATFFFERTAKGCEEENKSIFDQLFAHRAEIEQAFGGPLSWERLEGKRACRIKFAQEGGGYRSPEDQWPKMQDNIIAAMNRLEQALRPFLKQLKLNP